MAVISLKGVGKVYGGGVRAVEELDLDVADGELLVLLGPSGCGKTTVLRLLAGLEELTEGEIRVGDRRIDGLPPGDRDVAMIFQNYALYPHKTVRQNLEFPLRMRSVPRPQRERRVAEVAALLDLEAVLDRRPGQLSGGQQQRVAMGRALVREPAAFLMDEPLSNLDAQLRSRIRSELGALQRRLAITTLFVTHDQVEAMTLGERIAVMRGGRLQQLGTPDDLYRRPGNLFVATFVGQPPMNLLSARLEKSEAGWGVRLEHARGEGGGTGSAREGRSAAGLLCLSDEVVAGVGLRAAEEPVLLSGRPVVLGLRPEALSLVDAAGPGALFSGRVSAVESLGPERLVHVETALAGPDPGGGGGRAAVIVRRPAAGAAPRVGEAVGVAAEEPESHLFGSDGNSLTS